MRVRAVIALVMLAAPLLAACKEDTAPRPPPVELTRDDNGYFCHMIIIDHPGPKAQIHIGGRERPLFFPAVVDAVGYLMLPGESKAIRAIYVNDMGKAHNWKAPEPGTWIDANTAYFVIDSKIVSGMGHKEAVPFGTKLEADGFAGKNGGRVVRLGEIPRSYVFPGVNEADASAASSGLPKVTKEAVP
jgi:copper chaperone NosL